MSIYRLTTNRHGQHEEVDIAPNGTGVFVAVSIGSAVGLAARLTAAEAADMHRALGKYLAASHSVALPGKIQSVKFAEPAGLTFKCFKCGGSGEIRSLLRGLLQPCPNGCKKS